MKLLYSDILAERRANKADGMIIRGIVHKADDIAIKGIEINLNIFVHVETMILPLVLA